MHKTLRVVQPGWLNHSECSTPALFLSCAPYLNDYMWLWDLRLTAGVTCLCLVGCGYNKILMERTKYIRVCCVAPHAQLIWKSASLWSCGRWEIDLMVDVHTWIWCLDVGPAPLTKSQADLSWIPGTIGGST